MKIGIRRPSIRGRISARTSWRRYVRHNLGFKAPRGWGWLTNPRKAAYNRIYSRTTFSIFRLIFPRRRKRKTSPLREWVIVFLLMLPLFFGLIIL